MSEATVGVVGIVLAVAGILVGFLTSLYFYGKAREFKDPRYDFHLTDILSGVQATPDGLHVTFNGQEVKRLSSCALVIWNRGTKTIEGVDIAESDPLRIVFPAATQIFSVSVAPSRNAVGFTAVVDEQHPNIVLLSFDFMDRSDGGTAEILYEADSSEEPELLGSIRGVRDGLRRPPLGLRFDPEIEDERGADEEDDSPWQLLRDIPKTFIFAFAVLAIASALLLGWSHPVTVVVFTLIGVIVVPILALVAGMPIALRYLALPDERKRRRVP